eukprot:8469896-Alexandrium_andersonii.AAC.1
MSASLVGSEMCIRDRCPKCAVLSTGAVLAACGSLCALLAPVQPSARGLGCLLYTSDAADDM